MKNKNTLWQKEARRFQKSVIALTSVITRLTKLAEEERKMWGQMTVSKEYTTAIRALKVKLAAETLYLNRMKTLVENDEKGEINDTDE